MDAIKLRGRVRPDGQLELPVLPAELPEGEVELILLYEKKPMARPSPLSWPSLDGGRYLKETLRREEI